MDRMKGEIKGEIKGNHHLNQDSQDYRMDRMKGKTLRRPQYDRHHGKSTHPRNH